MYDATLPHAERHGQQGCQQCSLDNAPDIASDPYQDVLNELETQRQSAPAQPDDHRDDFRLSLLGGAWQMERVGRSTYGHRVDLKTKSPMHAFAKKFSLGLSASFEMHVFGERGSHSMTCLWQARLVQLYTVWESHDKPSTFPEKVPPLVVPTEHEAHLSGLPPRAQKRLKAVLSLCPAAVA